MSAVEEFLECNRNVLLGLTFLGVLYLVLKTARFRSPVYWQEGIGASALGFDSLLTGANQISSQRAGMMGNEPPVFWDSAYAPSDANGGVRGAVRDDVVQGRVVPENAPDVAAVEAVEGLTVGKASQAGYALGRREGIANLQNALLGR